MKGLLRPVPALIPAAEPFMRAVYSSPQELYSSAKLSIQ
jgi:hypothetical protein